MTAIAFLARLRRLNRVMPLADALRFARYESRAGDIKIYLPSIAREVALRGATTDPLCFDKVFIDEEYRSPYDCEPKTIVDAGANIGMATLYFSNRFPNAHIMAIEPHPQNFEMLQRNCAGLPNVTLVCAALWPRAGKVTISDHHQGEWAYSVTEERAQPGTTEVPSISLNDIFERLKVDHIDILKLDIEGSERELFSVDPETWLERVGIIIIELHDRIRPGCARALYSALAGKDFKQEVRGENIFIELKESIELGQLDGIGEVVSHR
jgi:FkbM family methyltransferase